MVLCLAFDGNGGVDLEGRRSCSRIIAIVALLGCRVGLEFFFLGVGA